MDILIGDNMINYDNFEAWFITGSQHLYGEETLKQVDDDSKKNCPGFI